MRYLLIEDDRKVADFVAEALRDDGHEVELLAEGGSAPQRIIQGEYDAILLDFMLPGLSGPEIVIRVRDAGVRTPILLVTARDAAEDIAAGLAAGADDYITKPFRLADLFRRLDQLTSVPGS